MDKKRSSYWDNWKGLAIIAVVAIHASSSTGTYPEGSFNWLFGLSLRQAINYAVPMFLALSGYFAANSFNESITKYYSKRIWKLFTPYAIWTIIYIALKTPLIPPTIPELIKGFILGSGIGIGYFVIVLLQCILLTPLLMQINRIRTHMFIISAGTAFGLAFSYYFRTEQTSSFFSTFPGNGLLFFVWYPFYHFGFFAARYKSRLNICRITPSFLFLALFITLALSFAEGLFWSYRDMYSVGVSQIKASSYAASLIIFVIAINYSDKESWLDKRNVLTWLGQNSYAIYLTHLLLLNVSTKVYGKIDVILEVQPVFVLLSTVSSIIGCAVFILIVRKIFTNKTSNIILG